MKGFSSVMFIIDLSRPNTERMMMMVVAVALMMDGGRTKGTLVSVQDLCLVVGLSCMQKCTYIIWQ
jgi:hypothetical protein